MTSSPRKLDTKGIQNLSQGVWAESMYNLLVNLSARMDALETKFNAEFAATTVLDATSAAIHKAADANLVTTADAYSEASAVALANALKTAYALHIADTDAHPVADATNTTAAADATDESSAITLANELKADYNAHRSQATVHLNNDGGNAVAAADATDADTLNTLLNEIKADYNAHVNLTMGIDTTAGTHESILV